MKQILLSHDSSPSLDKKLICLYGNSKTAIRELSLLCVCVCVCVCIREHAIKKHIVRNKKEASMSCL